MTVNLTDDNEYKLSPEQEKALTQLYDAMVRSVKRAIKEAKKKRLVEATVDDIKMNIEFVELFMKKLKIGVEK